MEDNDNLPIIEKKEINGVEITNLEIAKIAMVCDYIVLDRFQDIASFLRFEKCFGPLFPNEKSNFLFEVFQEICGHKKIYIIWSFNRGIHNMEIKTFKKYRF